MVLWFIFVRLSIPDLKSMNRVGIHTAWETDDIHSLDCKLNIKSLSAGRECSDQMEDCRGLMGSNQPLTSGRRETTILNDANNKDGQVVFNLLNILRFNR